MDEKYLQDLYSWIVSKDPSYQKDVTPDAFKQKMTDPTYASKMHGWISSLDPTFEKDLPLDKFNQRIGISDKKKEGTVLPSAGISSVSPATEKLVVGPMGITGLERTAEYKPAKEFEGKGVGYIVGDLLKTAGKEVVKFPADVLETASIVTAGVKNLIAQTGAVEEADASKFAIYKAAQEYKNLIEEVVPTDKDISNGFWGQAAKGIGQIVPIILSGAVSGGGKAIAKAAAKNGTKLESVINYGKNLASRMATPQGALTISQVAAPSYEQAKAEGATENQALTYAIQNALVSYPIEMLPVDGLFKRLDKTLVGNRGVEILKRAVIGGSEEAITEGLQNIYENVSANQIYGTTKDMLDGVGNASAVGGTVGVIMNGLLTALLGRRAKAVTNEEKTELDKSIKEVQDKVSQIESNNKKFVETINTLDQSKPITLPYGSANYNFLESPDGNIELAEDDMTKEQAEGVINNLSSTYKKIGFSIEEVEPEDPYKPTTYKVVGKPIKTEQYAIQKQTAGEVPVQPTPGISEEVEEGKPQPKLEGVTKEAVQIEVPQEKITPDIIENAAKSIKEITLPASEWASIVNDNYKDVKHYNPNSPEIIGMVKAIREKGIESLDGKITGKINERGEIMLVDGNHRMIALNEIDPNKKITVPIEFVEGDIKIDIDGYDLKAPATLRPQQIVSEAYLKAKQDNSNPLLVENVEKLIYETLPTQRLQPEPGIVQPQKAAEVKPTGFGITVEIPAEVLPKREEVKSSLKRIKDSGVTQITDEQIDAQMSLTDAMSKVWQETTGKNDFYDTFINDVKEGDVQALNEKGGVLFQNTELPQRPISRVTLGVFEKEPLFQKMKGTMVAPQSISDFMKSRGKPIEREIINTVLDFDKYKGQKRIPFDEFRDDVETQLMKLERIDSKSYASYGMDNLGDNQNYGKAQTIIFNSPIDHGQYGHFRNDFVKGLVDNVRWEVRQIPTITDQYVAIDADMPANTPGTQIAQYIGTAGTRADVERWVADRTSASLDKEINKGLFGHIRNWYNDNTGVYTLAELQSDYFQKNKATDLYASRIPKEEVDEYINKNFRRQLDKEFVDRLKKEINLDTKIFLDAEGNTKINVFAKNNPENILHSASYNPSYAYPIGYTAEEQMENQAVVEASRRLANLIDEIADIRAEIIEDYTERKAQLQNEEDKYIAKRIEEIKKSEEGNLMMKQFIASQKVHELRLFREALKHAADKGAKELWFPTPFTIANIEGYVSANGNAPYQVIDGDEGRLYAGDIINYGGERMTVVEASDYSITVVPTDQVSVFNIETYRDDEINNRMDELEYDLKRQVSDINNITREEAESYNTDEWMSEEIFKQLKEYFDENPEEETVAWSKIDDNVREYVSDYYNDMGVQELVSWAPDVYQDGDMVFAIENTRGSERFGQPSEYESQVDEENFENDLSEDQYTVVKKYDELGEMMRKMRPDVTEVTDNNGKKWLRTAITEADATNPIIAFQEEGGKIKGAIDFSNDNKASIYIFNGADISTLAHEMSGHIGRRVLEQLSSFDEKFAKDYENAKKWAGVKDNQWSRAAEEKWARGFERYLLTGKAPSAALKNVFQKLRDWLTNIYRTIKGSSIDIELTPEITAVFDNLLATKGEQLMTADTKDATVLQKVYDFLDKLDSDLEKFGKETAGVNIPVPIMRAIIKSVKALVKTGITLQDAIRRAAIENKVSEQDVMDSINALTKKRAVEGKPEGVTEMELPGYNRMIGELEGVIQKSGERGVSEEKTMQNAMNYLQGSKVYQDASDTQREKMVRDVRKMFGKREKAAPKPEKLFGEVKDVKQITMSEYDLYKQQLKDEAKGAKNAISVWKKTSGALASYLKKMADGGYLTAKQTAAVLRKFSSVNMLDDNSINRFVDYMQKVFKNADYAEQIAQVNAMLPTAKKNIQNKIGTSQTLFPLLKQLFAIKPTLIPDVVFDKYVGIVEMMGERKAVLNLDEYGKVTDTVDEILDAVDEEVSRSEELSELFNSYPDKLVDEDGKVDFTGTIKKMLENEEITEKDAEIMRKYKSSILPMIQKEKKSDEEISAEKEVLVDAVKSSDIDFDGLAMKDERNLARELERLIKTDAVNGLDNAQLNNLLRVIDNINNGYMPHYGELMVERLNAINNSKTLEQSVDKADPLTVEEHYAKLKSLITRKEKLSELIRRNPQYFIDQVFGDFKTKNIFNSIFEKPAEAQSLYKSAVNEVRTKLDEAKNKVSKSFNYDGNKLTMSSFKMMTYLVQLEYESNPGSKQVNPASEYLKTTIEHIKDGESRFGLRDAKMLQKILKDYSDADGNIDKDKLYNSFNPAEKSAIKTVQKINEDNTDKAIYTAAIIRGDRIHPLNNYVHLNVLHDYKPEESFEGASSVSLYSNSRKPSTKAKSLIERTGKVSPLDFDVFTSASRGANFTLMDYYLTEPIRTARKTFNETAKLMKEKMEQRDAAQKEKPLSDKAQEKQDNEDQLRRDIFNAIKRAFEESVDDVLVNNVTSTSFGDEVSAYMTKQGYRAVLASVPRFISELTSNIGFVSLAAPKEMKVGIANRDISFSNALPKIMKVTKSKQINRIFPHDTVSGRLVDTSILEQAGGAKGGRSRNDVANKILQINDLTLKKYVNVIELIADALVSTPDKLIMRPLWTGSFISEFKKITGKDVDLDKIENEDEKYIAANQEAINKARDVADEKTTLAGATDNAFMGVLKGKKKPNQSIGLRAFNMFNNFMTNFIIYEYSAARKGIYAAMGNGDITRKQGVALMAGVAARTTLYTVLLSVLGEATVSLFVDDEDKDDEKSLLQKFGQAIASSATSLFLGRNFGNATKALVNQGVEYMNEKYLDFLRKGDYDPYKDAIQYTVMPPESKGKKASYQDMLMNMMGPFGPSMKTSELIFRKATEEPKKEAAARQRVEKEKNIRIPLEVLGNLGMIPLYKDVRKIVNKEIYKELDNAEKKQPMNKIGKEDMKKYFPDMYNQLYGPGGALYDVELMKKELRKEKEKMKEQIKNEMYR